MSLCDNCIFLECTDGMCCCLAGHRVIFLQEACEDFKHWNSLDEEERA